MRALLDVNVLLALLDRDHIQHRRARRWFASAAFEDAVQVAAARACGASHIVTRNVRHFARSPIPAITPREALAQLF